jgi:FRG domain-containing protein
MLEYRGWPQFKAEYIRDLFQDGVFRPGVYVFRGQSDDGWTLESSFDRWFRVRYRDTTVDRLKVANALIEEFRLEISRRFPSHAALGGTEEDIIALAQHFGVPTRLLDWSGSPYIAAFFAFSDAVSLSMASKEICIWALRRDAPVWNADAGVRVVDLPGGGNDRLQRQSGCFTLNRTPFRSLEEYVRNGESDVIALLKAVIPTREAFVALADLDAMGINHVSTFPEVGGCALAAQLRVLMGRQSSAKPG